MLAALMRCGALTEGCASAHMLHQAAHCFCLCLSTTQRPPDSSGTQISSSCIDIRVRRPSALLPAGWRCRWYISTKRQILPSSSSYGPSTWPSARINGYVLAGEQLHGLPIGLRTWQATLGLSLVVYFAAYHIMDAWGGWVRCLA